MKNSFLQIASGLALTLVFTACEKDETQVVSQPGAAPTLTANSNDAGLLLSGKAEESAVVYTWTPVTFSFSDGSKPTVPVTYTLEFAKAGTNFAQVGTVAAGVDQNTAAVKVAELNGALVKAGLTPTQEGVADVRLRAHYAGNQADMLSAVSSIKATPYSRDLFFFGNDANSGLGALSSSSSYLREGKTPGQFEGYVYAPNATNTFKLSNTNTASGTIYGAGGTAAGTITAGSTATDFTLAGPKMYRVQVNLAKSEFKAVATDWGVVGAATTGDDTGWSKSKPMTYNVKNKVWELLDVPLLGAGAGKDEFKFRANDAWDINLGTDKTTPSILVQDGNNLKITGNGKYDVTLNLNDPEKYVYTLKKK